MIYGNYSLWSLDWKNLVNMFTPVRGSTYQPVRVLSYGIDYYFWKLNPVGYHITNLLFYALTCIFVFLTIQRLSAHLRPGVGQGSHERVALAGTLLFAVHPIHVEAVAWLAARKEVLQGSFFFLALYLYLRAREVERRGQALWLGGTLLSIVLAILSKPSAVVFPGVIVIYEIARRKEKVVPFLRRHWLFFSLSIGISAVFTFILMRAMIESGGIKPYYGDTFAKNALVPFYVFLRTGKLLLLTLRYAAAYSFLMSLPVFSLKNGMVVGVTLLLCGASVLTLRWSRVVFFSFFFFLVTVLPFLNIFPISTLLADRYVFIASFAYAFLGGVVFDRLYTFQESHLSEDFFRWLATGLFALLLVGYSVVTVRQNAVWHDSYALWSDAVEKSPDSNTANAMMGVVYTDLRMDEKARACLEKAVQILPRDYHSHNNLGVIYGRLGMFEEAADQFRIAVGIRPKEDACRINLAIIYTMQKEFQKAEEILLSLIAKSPGNTNLKYRLHLVHREKRDYAAAISDLEELIQISPNIPDLYASLGNIYLQDVGNPAKARHYFTKAVEAAPKGISKGEELRWMLQDIER